jgi:SAM-dependent methyltransferase
MKTGKELFNAWAANYDQLLDAGTASISFEGYEDVLAETIVLAQVVPGMCVLDLGTGTGNLAARFVSAGCEVWGMDFSERHAGESPGETARPASRPGRLAIDKLSIPRIIPPNTLKDFEEDEYASYGGQRTGCNRWKSCPHDGAEWTSELQSETIAG